MMEVSIYHKCGTILKAEVTNNIDFLNFVVGTIKNQEIWQKVFDNLDAFNRMSRLDIISAYSRYNPGFAAIAVNGKYIWGNEELVSDTEGAWVTLLPPKVDNGKVVEGSVVFKPY